MDYECYTTMNFPTGIDVSPLWFPAMQEDYFSPSNGPLGSDGGDDHSYSHVNADRKKCMASDVQGYEAVLMSAQSDMHAVRDHIEPRASCDRDGYDMSSRPAGINRVDTGGSTNSTSSFPDGGECNKKTFRRSIGSAFSPIQKRRDQLPETDVTSSTISASNPSSWDMYSSANSVMVFPIIDEVE